MNLPGIFASGLEYLCVWDLEQKMFEIPNSQNQIIFLLGFIGSLTSHYRRFKPDVDPM